MDIATETPAPAEDASGELEAIIEEARQRARRRRRVIAAFVTAGALAIGAGVLFVGGGGGNGASGGSGSSDDGSAGDSPQSSSSAVSDYRCPTSRRELRELPPAGAGIPGCRVTILAELPEGWQQQPKSVVTFPPQTMGFIASATSHFANFDLGHSRPNSLRPAVSTIPNDGVLVSVTASQSRRNSIAPTFAAEDLRPTRVDSRAFARDRVEVDGIELTIEGHAGEDPIDPALAEDVEAIIASLDTSQELCPCGELLNLDRPTLQMLERRDRQRVDLTRPGS